MLSQSQASIFNQTLMSIDFEIRSDKPSIREKALTKIHQILINRSDDLIELLSNPKSNVDITWYRLFETAHQNIVDASTKLAAAPDAKKLTTLKNKVDDKINIIQKIVALSSEDGVFRISHKSILQKAFECFRNRSMVQYFGDCYLQIITKHVLNVKADLSEIKGDEWSELLSRCFEICNYDTFTQRLILFQCITTLIDVGLNYAPLVLDLPKHIPKLIQIANEEHKSNAANEVYRIVYIFCKNLALDYRFAICELTESVLGTIIKNFPKSGEDTKLLICKILHISLIVHSPQGPLDDRSSDYAVSEAKWNLHVRNMIHLVQTELLRLGNIRMTNSNSAICESFILFAAKLCSVAFWKKSVWETSSTEPQSKRRKYNDKIQGITDLVEVKVGVFCWRWLSILAQLLNDYPDCVSDEDFQPLLQVLSDFQGTIEFPIQIQTLRSVVKALLIREPTLQSSTYVNENVCNNLWEKIAKTASRTAAANRPNLLENTKLLQILVTHKQLPTAFIQSIWETYLSSCIPRTNESISLIIAIFRHTNVDSLVNSDRLRFDTLNWLHTTSIAMELKNISSSDLIDMKLKAELSVLCLFSKVDDIILHQCSELASEYKAALSDLETTISFRCLKKMIFTQKKGNLKDERHVLELLPQPNQIRSIINENYLRKFEIMLVDVEMTNNPFEDVINVVSSLNLFVLLLGQLIAYAALDIQSLNTTFFAKKMKFKVEQMEMCMIRLATGRFESKENMEIVEKLMEVLNDTVHPALAQIIKSQTLNGIVNWLNNIVNDKREKNSRCLLLKTYDQLKFDQKVRFKAFALLCYLSNGINGEAAFEVINLYEFNLMSNGDLCIVLHLIKAMTNQPKNFSQADWLFRNLKELCMLHHKSNQISEQIIDSLPMIVNYINTYSAMTDEMISIIRDFVKKLRKNRYGPQIVIKMLSHMKFIARDYSMHFGNEEFENLFAQLKDFLEYKMLNVQFASIDSLIAIFDKVWIDESSTSMRLKLFHRKLFEHVMTETADGMETEDLDDSCRHICVRGQLIAGLISSNYVLRKESWFLLAELCFKHQLNSEKIRPIISALCEHHQMDHDMLVNENLFYLMSEWLIRSYPMANFPWYITAKESQSDFFHDNVEALTICILRHKPNDLADFARIMDESEEELIKAVLPNCMAYLTPILAECSGISDTYKENGKVMSRLIQNKFGDFNEILCTNFLSITENLLSNLWDHNTFQALFGLEIDYEAESYNIDIDVFTKSLEYLQSKSSSSDKDIHLITDFCVNRPLEIYNFLLVKKLQLQNTKYVDEQLIHFFHYCVVVDKVASFLATEERRPQSKKSLMLNKKASLLRDIVYFICNILIDVDVPMKLKEAACKYYRNFAGKVLPSCSHLFKPLFNFTVSSLMPLVKNSTCPSVSRMSLDCIKFLVIDQKGVLSDEIALLDNFPENDDEFDELRQIHFEVKYRGKTFSLTEEIDYFLKVDHRKIEGLVALREQLVLKKHELSGIYDQLQDMCRLSEDREKSLIHQLVIRLLQFVQGFDSIKAIEAAKCLGELGPSDLSSMVLKPDHQTHTYEFTSTFEKATESLCEAAFIKLNRLLLHPDAKVLKAVSSCLVFLLQSETGKRLVEQFSYLQLFQASGTQKRSIYNVTKKTLDLESLFVEEEYSTHSVWLKKLTKVLFDLFDDTHLQEVALLQLSFADTMLPLLIKMVLLSQYAEYLRSLQKAVVSFFEKHYESHDKPSQNTKQPIYLNKASVKCMITVAECIRIYNLNSSHKIELPYMHIAKAAQFCEAYFTSVMYIELWALEIEAKSAYTLSQIKCETNLQEIMKKAYISIGDMDAVSSFLDPISSRQTYLQLMNAYDRISLQMDVDLGNNPETMADFESHLANSGLFALANALPQKTVKQFECAWRLGDWNVLINQTTSDDFEQKFEKQHYIALKSLQTKDEMGVRQALAIARNAVISFVKHLSLECTNNIYPHLQRLTLLQQIEDFCQVQFDKPDQSVPNVFMKWTHLDTITFSDFKYKEPILAQRISIFNSAGVRATRKLNSLYGVQHDALQTMLLNLASECRLEGKKNLAIRYLASLNAICTSEGSKAKVLLEDAQLNWSIGDQLLAKNILARLLPNNVESYCTRIIARRLLGQYKAESYSESVETLISKNFNYSLEMLDKFNENRAAFVAKGFNAEFTDKFIAENRVKAYEAIAKYSDREYNQICVYKKSNQFETKIQTVARNEETLNENKPRVKTTLCVDTKRTLKIMNDNVNIDKKEIQGIEADKSKFLLLALENYLKICCLSDEFNDTTVFRIISLWFANKNSSEVTAILKSDSAKIASYKFLPALPQISARIASGDEDFNRLISSIMVRCATDHPQHTLYQLLSLSNAYADDPAVSKKKASEPRVLGAIKILDQLKKDGRLKHIISQMERMCSTLIELANVKMCDTKGKEPISSKDLSAFRGLSHLDLVHCPTLTLPVSKSANYDNLISVHRWSKNYSLCGGINAPLKISCVCSDGNSYEQLLKGKDDLRQDAVMQQVFTIMNNMLRSNKETRKRKLYIRTYKIVPFSQRSGILEWCANTTTMADYLTSTNSKSLGAHQRHYPKDLTPSACRSVISNYRTQNKSLGEKLSEFKKICSQFHPVFHNYFFEKFLRPGMWFERRLAYTNSVATTSMIGYILGIGDRHISNILIDQTTAELVHIDFGIAFEQARILPTPEKVPFRLTRDIAAGFGVSGENGVFRKSCEKTMDVLRHNKSTIITILEVLLYDPLHMWTLTTKEASKRQNVVQNDQFWASDDDTLGDKKNAMAERALLRLEAKLNGQEEGLLTQQLTTEGQVDMLILQAMNPLNLCQLFEGWQAYV